MKIITEVEFESTLLDSNSIIQILLENVDLERCLTSKPVTAALFKIAQTVENPNISIAESDKEMFFKEHFDEITLEDLETIVNSKRKKIVVSF